MGSFNSYPVFVHVDSLPIAIDIKTSLCDHEAFLYYIHSQATKSTPLIVYLVKHLFLYQFTPVSVTEAYKQLHKH